MLKRVSGVLVGVSSAAAIVPAHAAIDRTSITGAVTASDVTVGVLAIGAVLATIYATIKAAKIAIGMLRGGQSKVSAVRAASIKGSPFFVYGGRDDCDAILGTALFRVGHCLCLGDGVRPAGLI